MNAIVTVVGQDRVGIIAAICNKLATFNVNILDISQTILQGSFTMVMAVDVSEATASFGEVGEALAELGTGMGLSIRIQRQEIFNAMHTL
ncbi:ACT domain-containing protein [Oscillibacter sp.]|uniref:ACT domain-containing protein n=1 Tax=Oscillibacter sp. TaxID=1945593 RepID=UPI0026305811|nr:ACT domain-containing protein [Oscillibacter sp.]MDD3347612.1 ACT domain-containing protein [Oscillibacter sp.]